MARGWVSNPQTVLLLWKTRRQPLIPTVMFVLSRYCWTGQRRLVWETRTKSKKLRPWPWWFTAAPIIPSLKKKKKTMTRWLFVCLLVQGQDGSKGEKGNLGLLGNPGEPGLRGKDVSKSWVDVTRKVDSQQFIIHPVYYHFIASLKRLYIDLYLGNPRAARQPRAKGTDMICWVLWMPLRKWFTPNLIVSSPSADVTILSPNLSFWVCCFISQRVNMAHPESPATEESGYLFYHGFQTLICPQPVSEMRNIHPLGKHS